MIRLRTTPAQIEDVGNLLLDAVEQVTGERGLLRLHLYKNASFRTDLALSLVWDTSRSRLGGSKAGLSISEALKSFGLVEHSIWLENQTG